ncbi:MAG: DNRLRE domain-containing protein, partial [Armatimonadota bacterium]
MIKKIFASVTLAAMIVCTPIYANTISIGASADNWINSCSSGSFDNNGDFDQIRVRSAWWGPSGGEVKTFRSIMKFDLSSLDPSVPIISATLKLYRYRIDEDPTGRTYDIHALTNSWTEMGSTWNYRDNYDIPGSEVPWDSYTNGNPSYKPGGGDFISTPAASTIVSSEIGWMEWDITSLVNAWLSGDIVNNVLIIKDNDEITTKPQGGN